MRTWRSFHVDGGYSRSVYPVGDRKPRVFVLSGKRMAVTEKPGIYARFFLFEILSKKQTILCEKRDYLSINRKKGR